MEIKVLPERYLNARLVVRYIVGVSAFSFKNAIKNIGIFDFVVMVAFTVAVTTNVTPTEMYLFLNREVLQNT